MPVQADLRVGFHRAWMPFKNIAQSKQIFPAHAVRGNLNANRGIVEAATFGHKQQALPKQLDFTGGIFAVFVQIAVVFRLFVKPRCEAKGLL